jgi:hypothetical protein
LAYGPDGELGYPRHDDRTSDSALSGYREEARRLFTARAAPDADSAALPGAPAGTSSVSTCQGSA